MDTRRLCTDRDEAGGCDGEDDVVLSPYLRTSTCPIYRLFVQVDRIRNSPRFATDARAANLALVDLLKRVAERKRATPAQVALAWLLAQKPWIVPIPGTTKLHRLEENLGAVNVELTTDDLREIEEGASGIEVKGARLPETVLKYSNR